MDEAIDKLNTFLDELKSKGEKVPAQGLAGEPHIKAISAASGVPYRFFSAHPITQRLAFACQEIGINSDIEKGESARQRLESLFQRNCSLINSYLKSLEAQGLKLPRHPKHCGELFWEQVGAESGVAFKSLVSKKHSQVESDKICLRDMVEEAASRIGMEVRIAPLSTESLVTPLTYAFLLEQGTTERRQELAGKSGADQQLYNTRSALKRFCKMLEIDLTTLVGEEFVLTFIDNLQRLTGEIENSGTRKKFQSEIGWWQAFHQRLIDAQPLPRDFHCALAHLISNSGMPFSVVAKLSGVTAPSLIDWAAGTATPSALSFDAISRLESLFKLPHGALVNKLRRFGAGRRFRFSHFPSFIRDNPYLAQRISCHLPDNFCEQPAERQKEIVDWICINILKCNDDYTQRLSTLVNIPYRLKEWPARLNKEFEDFAAFKTSDRPPLGMQRNGQWRITTEEMVRGSLASLFGAINLLSSAEDVRARGLGVQTENLTLALIACPLVIDWYTRFHCETRNVYTNHMVVLLKSYKSMLRPLTGWIRQQPQLAFRLHPLYCDSLELVSEKMVEQARSDWDSFCDSAIAHYNQLIKEITPLVQISRDSFHRIEGILDSDNPIEVFDILIKGMRGDMPNKNTQPDYYHTRIRNCAIVILIALTGYRRNTIRQLTYTGNHEGHLRWKNGKYVLMVPRKLFKVEDSPYFGRKHSQNDSYIELPDMFGLVEILSEYLNVSRPYLLSKYHPKYEESLLFVNSSGAESVGLSTKRISRIFYIETEKHLVANKYRGTGLACVRRYGPHGARHIRGTTVVKKTGNFQIAGDANQHSERTARKYYARYNTKDRNKRVNEVLFGKDDKNSE
jgi:hypothetical protein